MWRLISRKDIAGAAVAAVIVAGLIVGYIVWPGYSRFTGTQSTLGPDWTCTYPGKGDPICVKKAKPD
ncbi:MAG TPA: hypothetical protein VMI56_25555 [Reyranella sp.]|nr:hypothetical protein [Reyranella sp.]